MVYGTRKCIPKVSPIIPILRAESTQFLVLIHISLRSILISSSHLRLGLIKGLFPVSLTNKLTSWLMEPRVLMPHSQGLLNNPYPQPNQLNFKYWQFGSLKFILMLSYCLRLARLKGLFSYRLSVKSLKAYLIFSILLTWPANLNLLDLRTLIILCEPYKL